MPIAVKALIAYDQTKKGRTFDEFEGRVGKELPPVQQKARKEIAQKTVAERIKLVAQKAEEEQKQIKDKK